MTVHMMYAGYFWRCLAMCPIAHVIATVKKLTVVNCLKKRIRRKIGYSACKTIQRVRWNLCRLCWNFGMGVHEVGVQFSWLLGEKGAFYAMAFHAAMNQTAN